MRNPTRARWIGYSTDTVEAGVAVWLLLTTHSPVTLLLTCLVSIAYVTYLLSKVTDLRRHDRLMRSPLAYLVRVNDTFGS